MNPVISFLVAITLGIGAALANWVHPVLGLAFLVLAFILALSLKVANTWQKFVILRLGKLHRVRGAGFLPSLLSSTTWWRSSTSAFRPQLSMPSTR